MTWITNFTVSLVTELTKFSRNLFRDRKTCDLAAAEHNSGVVQSVGSFGFRVDRSCTGMGGSVDDRSITPEKAISYISCSNDLIACGTLEFLSV